MPLPGVSSVLSVFSNRLNRSKMCSNCCGSIVLQEFTTRNSRHSEPGASNSGYRSTAVFRSIFRKSIEIRPCRGVYFTAFETRLVSIFRARLHPCRFAGVFRQVQRIIDLFGMGAETERAGHIPDERHDIRLHDVQRDRFVTHPAEIQQLVDQSQQPVGVVGQSRYQFMLVVFVQRAMRQQFDVSVDQGQRSP